MKKTITAKRAAALFFHKVYLCFGLYDKIIFNQGLQFTSSFARELGKLLKYNLFLSTAYHPQSDRETEWVNQEVKTYLWIFCGNNPRSWANNIFHAEFAHNHCPHSITSQSPFYFMMEYKPCALPSVISDTSILAIEASLKTLSAACNEAWSLGFPRTRMPSYDGHPYSLFLYLIQTRRQSMARSQKSQMIHWQPKVCT